MVVATSAEHAEVVRGCLEARVPQGALELKFLERDGPLDLLDALRLAAPLIDRAPCIVHPASGLFAEPLTPLLSRLRNDRPDVMLFMHQQAAPDCRLTAETQQMLHIAELHPEVASFGIAGLSLFGQGALQRVAAVGWKDEGEVDLTTIAALIAEAQGSFQVRFVDGWCRYAGDPSDLLELNTTALDRLPANGRRPPNSGNRIEGRVHIDARADVRTSVIIGPAVIGPDASVSDAYIGPYTSIGSGASIISAEIERSIVCARASLSHIGGRVVGSIIGPDARVFKDFSLPRALRLRLGEGTEVALF